VLGVVPDPMDVVRPEAERRPGGPGVRAPSDDPAAGGLDLLLDEQAGADEGRPAGATVVVERRFLCRRPAEQNDLQPRSLVEDPVAASRPLEGDGMPPRARATVRLP
jgi:hypothetical protein